MKNKNWHNIKSLANNTLSLINWGKANWWKLSRIEKRFFVTSPDSTDTEKGMLEECMKR